MEEIHKIDIKNTQKLFDKVLEEHNEKEISEFQVLMNLEEQINNCLNNDTKTKVELGGYLEKIKNYSLYKLKGYDKFDKYCENDIGLSKDYSNRLVQIFNFLYTNHGDVAVNLHNYHLYSISQLREFLTLTKEQLQSISPEMTIKQIRALKQNNDTEEEHNEDCDCEDCNNIHLHNIKQCKNTLHDFNIENKTYNYDYFTTFNKQDLSYIAWLLYDELNRLRNKKVKVA